MTRWLKTLNDGLKSDSGAKGISTVCILHGYRLQSQQRCSQGGRGLGANVARSRPCQVPISSQHLAPPPALPVMASPMGSPLVLLRVAPKYCG